MAVIGAVAGGVAAIDHARMADGAVSARFALAGFLHTVADRHGADRRVFSTRVRLLFSDDWNGCFCHSSAPTADAGASTPASVASHPSAGPKMKREGTPNLHRGDITGWRG